MVFVTDVPKWSLSLVKCVTRSERKVSFFRMKTLSDMGSLKSVEPVFQAVFHQWSGVTGLAAWADAEVSLQESFFIHPWKASSLLKIDVLCCPIAALWVHACMCDGDGDSGDSGGSGGCGAPSLSGIGILEWENGGMSFHSRAPDLGPWVADQLDVAHFMWIDIAVGLAQIRTGSWDHEGP